MNISKSEKRLIEENYGFDLESELNNKYSRNKIDSDWGIDCELSLPPNFNYSKEAIEFENFEIDKFKAFDPADTSFVSDSLSNCTTIANTRMYHKENRVKDFLKEKLRNTQNVINILKLELEMEQTKIQLLKQQLESECGVSTTNSPTLLPYDDDLSYISQIDEDEFSLDEKSSFDISFYENELSSASDKLDQFHQQGLELTNIIKQNSQDELQEDHYNRICDTLETLIQDAQDALGRYPSGTSLNVPAINQLRNRRSGSPSPTVTSYASLSRRSSIASFILDPKLEEGISMLMEQSRLTPSNLRTQILPASDELSDSSSFIMEPCSLCNQLESLVDICKVVIMNRITLKVPKILYYHYFKSNSYELPLTLIILSWRWIYLIYSESQFWQKTILQYIISYHLPLTGFKSAKISLFDTILTSREKDWKKIYLNHSCPV